MSIEVLLDDGTFIDSMTRLEEFDLTQVGHGEILLSFISRAIENGKRQEEEAAGEAALLEDED